MSDLPALRSVDRLDDMDDELAAIEAQIRALLPRGWRLVPYDVFEEGEDPPAWADLSPAEIALARADLAQARSSYSWMVSATGGGGGVVGPSRMIAAQRALSRLQGDILRTGDPGAFAARVALVRLTLEGLPNDVRGIAIGPDGRWAATSVGERPTLTTGDGLRLPVSGPWVDVAWMGEHLVTHEASLEELVVRSRDGSPVARWACPWSFVVGRDWIAAADTGEDPNDDILLRLVVWNADGSVRREWRPSASWEDPEVFALPGGGLGLLANTWSDEGWVMVLFDTIDGPPRRLPVPRLWDDLSLDGPAPTALGGDTFALLRRDSIWAWRGGDRAMTLIHEGPISITGREVVADGYRWLPGGRMVVRHETSWWEVRVIRSAVHGRPGDVGRG